LFISFSVKANDPFFGEKQETQASGNIAESNVEFAKNTENITACKVPDNLSAKNIVTDFDKMTLIGLVKINEVMRALFIDEKQQLLALKENDLLNNEIEIKHINLKSITYINWKLTKDCNIPYEINIKL
ncbi:TPA: hypothetical protein PW626_000624, partial [Mannheimia haemolytica]|nr:hypothetical protein [Mannheimia haemolytica]